MVWVWRVACGSRLDLRGKLGNSVRERGVVCARVGVWKVVDCLDLGGKLSPVLDANPVCE